MVLALGSVFSALEVVPLLFVGFEAWHNLKLSGAAPWVQKYRWPVYFFMAVAFWNLVGAGLFGFMITGHSTRAATVGETGPRPATLPATASARVPTSVHADLTK